MNCNEAREDVNLFVDGELYIQRQVELFRHIAVCAPCQSFMDATLRTKAIQRNEQISFPAELDEAVLSRIVSGKIPAQSAAVVQKRNFIWQKRIALPAPYAAAAVLSALLVGYLISGLLGRTAERQILPSSLQTPQGQPATVIMIYGMTPVEVYGKPALQSIKNNNQVPN